MDSNNNFMTIITNKIRFPSVFRKNTVFCHEPLYRIIENTILKSRYICRDFYFDLSEMQEKKKIIDFCETDCLLPVLIISQDCFDIGSEFIDGIFEQYTKESDTAFFDKESKLLAYVVSAENKIASVNEFENLHLNIDGGRIKKCVVDYSVPSDLKQLREINQKTQEKILAEHEKNGVQFISPESVGISPFAKIYEGAVIYAGTIIRGNSIIGADTVLGPNTLIDNSAIGENCVINSTQIYSSVIDDDVTIGPFCHIRPNCRIESGVHIGDFVEIKNSNIGKDTKAGHLTYIGDADVGERVNFGCGSVTANYDGVNKYRTNIADDAFIGCSTNLIAPINIGEGAYTAAGSTLSVDVPPDALAISRAREQKIVDGWVKKIRKK